MLILNMSTTCSYISGVNVILVVLMKDVNSYTTSSPLVDPEAVTGVGVCICGAWDCKTDLLDDVEEGEPAKELSTAECIDDCSEDPDWDFFSGIAPMLEEVELDSELEDFCFSGFLLISSFLSFFFSPLADPALDLNLCLNPFIILRA
ncbi:hypothetical protein OGATHE_002319 [Ogataea polymorpha]|uniref:Uncharacterized protein n=1 Tax=Ogataea polymorpha TaxID=460523 RepID=A0A9P8PHL0_9ASCO|nr:hypothetical protein OGATHE_002319 [Ogataea polymorpha]